jgi:hypothetical protein
MAEQLRESLRALADVFRNPGLRRLELAWVGSVTGEWAYFPRPPWRPLPRFSPTVIHGSG